MKTAHFNIREHTVPTCHIREYARATAEDQEDELHLAVKQYTPWQSSNKKQRGVTIIGAHANGFPKELYEPLWDDLYERLEARNIHIRNIFIADVSQQGQSGVLNEHKLGNDPSWMDHPRDLLMMVNYFKKDMKRPIIGIGHSMGGNNLINLSLMHPRLFTTLVLIDPVIQRLPSVQGNFRPAKASTIRRDRWPSRRNAEAAFKRSKFYKTWDPRVLERWIDHGLRELPTLLHPEVSTAKTTLPTVSADPSTASVQPDKYTEREVTLKTTKHQEVFTFSRPNFPSPTYPSPSTDPNPITHPDVDLETAPVAPFYRPEPLATFRRLPHVRPSVFYIFGDQSDLSAPLLKADKLAQTGIGVGGSGGLKKGRVAEVTFKGVGHLIPMEVVDKTADAVTGWVVRELERWQTIEDAERAEWEQIPMHLRSQFSDAFKRTMTGDWDSQVKDRGTIEPSKL
ncbi:hypothetical protein DOTSEDRAFT_68272 [Dothistroma septosporum NZE10]|uniref:Serine aminopeptidase S33 domain-containing protein n=1 Tax=Dothistroma septosporum (strain NZE10 / CBS 128990) TaxID=675120 RepID=N1Q415_DOTSN|nr:hypothetical protein DOTSEDRAFT_68272 [Dothistroma septosporum NZE10]